MTSMNHHSRSPLRIVCLLLALASPLPTAAHDGAHTPDMLAQVETATVSGDRVVVGLTLTGLGGPLVLTGIGAEGATTTSFAPVYVNFAEDVPVVAVLEFHDAVPGVFTLVLSFGPVGQGAVVVFPEPAPASVKQGVSK